MTSRERVKAVFEGRRPDRMPFNFWMDRDAMERLDRELGADFRISYYDADVIEAFAVVDMCPDFCGEFSFDGKTSWMLRGKVDSIDEAFASSVPSPDGDWYGDIAAKRAAHPDKAIFAMVPVPLAVLNSLLLPQQLMETMALEGDKIDRYLQKIWPAVKGIIEHVCDMDIDALYLAEDFCMSTGLIYSPDMLRRFHLDYLKEAAAAAHSRGKRVLYHTDGRVIEALPLLLELGADGINPLEPRYNSPEEFLHASRGELVLYGGMDNTGIIPQGTDEAVREHIKTVYEAFAPTGLIFSSHDIPGDTPRERIDLMAACIKNIQ